MVVRDYQTASILWPAPRLERKRWANLIARRDSLPAIGRLVCCVGQGRQKQEEHLSHQRRRPYDPDVKDGSEELCMEKVSLALVDDLTVGDGINLFTLLEAPYRPFLCYRARVALDGPILASRGGTTVRLPSLESKGTEDPRSNDESPSGRIKGPKGRIPSARIPPGPPAHRIRRVTDAEAEHEE